MLSKPLIGVAAALAVGLAIVFWLLLQAKEANGALTADLDEAVRANASQTEKIGRLEKEKREAAERFLREQARANAFMVQITEGERELEQQKRDFRKQIADVRKQLTVEELECADEPIPVAYFDGLRDNEGSHPD